MLRDGVDAVREVPRDRWDADALYDPDPAAPGKVATRCGAFLESDAQVQRIRTDAVALVRSSGKTVTEVAREIGVSAEGLRNWVKQDTIDRGQGAPGALTSAERGMRK